MEVSSQQEVGSVQIGNTLIVGDFFLEIVVDCMEVLDAVVLKTRILEVCGYCIKEEDK